MYPFLNLHEERKEMHYKPHAITTFYKRAVISKELMRSLLQMLK
jgi:hypothetical protein